MKKNILIIGASGNVGYEVSKIFYDKKFNLGLHYASNSKNLKKLSYNDSKIVYLKSKLNSENDCKKLVKNFVKKFKTIDIVIFCGTKIIWKKWNKLNFNDFIDAFKINCIQSFFIAKESLKKMKSGSKLIFLSSIAAKYFGSEKTFHYAIAKSALETMALGLGKKFLYKKINVNIIRPGFIEGKLQKKGRSIKEIKERIAQIPFKRAVKTEEVANLINYLCDDQAKNITGEIFTVGAGD